MEIATFAAGCFWGVEDTFRKLPGVSDAISGYCGGHHENPTYELVCRGDTGHAEAVEVHFDPSIISYEELLETFWEIHNPTLADRQGSTLQGQYRSTIFYHNDQQKQLAEASKAALDYAGIYQNPIVTLIVPASTFYRAEEYHQRYHEKHGGSCGI